MKRNFYPDLKSMQQAAARRIAEIAEASIAERGRFAVALSGGSTPRAIHELLCRRDYMDDNLWRETFVFWGDDRMVPHDSEHSNYRMAEETLLTHVPVHRDQIFPMPVDSPSEGGAQEYERKLTEVLGEPPVLDLCLLGMGPDGHTASLFPGSPLLEEKDRMVGYVPMSSLPPEVPRMTVTLPMIDASRNVLFLISGEAKRGIVDEIFNDPETAREKYPAARIKARDEVVWYVAAD